MKKIEILLLSVCAILVVFAIVIFIDDTDNIWFSIIAVAVATLGSMSRPKITKDKIQEKTIIEFQTAFLMEKDPFLKELLESGIKLLKEGKDPNAVIKWNNKIERLYRKFNK